MNGESPGTADPRRAAFLEWAKKSRVALDSFDPQAPVGHLASVGDMIAEASVVTLSEGVHGAAEPLAFRNQMFRYLVEHKSFTAIAIESGIVESRHVHDHVRTGRGDITAVLKHGISWTFDRLPQNAQLIRWMSDYNSRRHPKRKINFYGFDIPGSPGESRANRGVDTALNEVMDYLRRVDHSMAMAFQERLQPFKNRMYFDWRESENLRGYAGLAAPERDTLTCIVADLVDRLERCEARYRSGDSNESYEWAYRAGVGARQVDAWLRQTPHPGQPAPRTQGPASAIALPGDVRDRAQADNLRWIVDREGPAGKVLVFAHRYHLSESAVHANWIGSEPREVMGTYLRAPFGERLVTIGNLIGHGEVECAGEVCCDGTRQTLGPIPPGSMDDIAKEVGVPAYFLDLRAAPLAVTDWLSQVRPLGRGTLGGAEDVLDVPAGDAFDILFYLDHVTPACCPGSAEKTFSVTTSDQVFGITGRNTRP
jgi:erythromycin esterase